MLIGAMNHPAKDPLEQVRQIASLQFDFVDLTIEPPAAASWRMDAQAVRALLDELGLRVVGHTAYYLPIASPFEEIRRGAVAELTRCLQLFARMGAREMNVHPDPPAPHHSRRSCIEQNLRSLRELLRVSGDVGVGLMLENVPHGFNTVADLGPLLDELPELGLHLDIGHAYLRVRKPTVAPLLRAYGHRLRHVHLHDNNRDRDLHLPLGAGTIPITRTLRDLKRTGYDGTITVEVFSRHKHYLVESASLLRRTWARV